MWLLYAEEPLDREPGLLTLVSYGRNCCTPICHVTGSMREHNTCMLMDNSAKEKETKNKNKNKNKNKIKINQTIELFRPKYVHRTFLIT